MILQKKWKKLTIVLTVLLVCLLATAANFTLKYPINENGLTYGSAFDSISPNDEPDLILARGIDGTIGYVYASDLNGKEPKSPEEAISLQKMKTGENITIPLYEADGKTIIGEFRISSIQDITKIYKPADIKK